MALADPGKSRKLRQGNFPSETLAHIGSDRCNEQGNFVLRQSKEFGEDRVEKSVAYRRLFEEGVRLAFTVKPSSKHLDTAQGIRLMQDGGSAKFWVVKGKT